MPRTPLIRAGSTPATVLRERYAAVAEAILDLAVKIRASAPAQCDHDGAAAYQHAVNEHQAMLATLDKLRVHYREMLGAVQGQIDQLDTVRMVRQRP